MLWWLIFSLLFAGAAWALPGEYEVFIERNPFSPQRQYVPSANGGQGAQGSKGEDLKKELILRGTFASGNLRLAIIEVRPVFKRRYRLEKDRLVVGIGEKIGPCEVLEVRRGEVVLGGGCRQTVLRLADAPERKKPLPASPHLPAAPKTQKVNKPPSPGPKPQNPKPKATQKPPVPPNPFRKIFEKQKRP